MDSKELIAAIEGVGWYWHSTTGSHRHFKHPTIPGKITIPHPRKDLHPKIVKQTRERAGL